MIPHGYLVHHGIIGQKWGVRRFQNKDGSLTSSGKERYGKSGSNDKKDFNKMSYSEEKKYAKEHGIKMLDDFKKVYDKYGNDDDQFNKQVNTIFEKFERETGYKIDGYGSGSNNSWHIQFSRELPEPDEDNDLYYQQWRIHEDKSEPDGYWLEDLDRDW